VLSSRNHPTGINMLDRTALDADPLSETDTRYGHMRLTTCYYKVVVCPVGAGTPSA